MGGGWSGGTEQASQVKTAGHYYHHKGDKNNNKGDVVIIPVDQSKQAEAAFECKSRFILFICSQLARTQVSIVLPAFYCELLCVCKLPFVIIQYSMKACFELALKYNLPGFTCCLQYMYLKRKALALFTEGCIRDKGHFEDVLTERYCLQFHWFGYALKSSICVLHILHIISETFSC